MPDAQMDEFLRQHMGLAHKAAERKSIVIITQKRGL